MRKLFVSLLVTMALVGATVAGFATAANASVNGCPDGGYICFYDSTSFNTSPSFLVAYAAPINTCRTISSENNKASSILYNWTGSNVIQRTIYMYDNTSCSGSNFVQTVYPGQLNTTDSNLASIGWNNRVSSFKVQ